MPIVGSDILKLNPDLKKCAEIRTNKAGKEYYFVDLVNLTCADLKNKKSSTFKKDVKKELKKRKKEPYKSEAVVRKPKPKKPSKEPYKSEAVVRKPKPKKEPVKKVPEKRKAKVYGKSASGNVIELPAKYRLNPLPMAIVPEPPPKTLRLKSRINPLLM